jgi:hypothetical protein
MELMGPDKSELIANGFNPIEYKFTLGGTISKSSNYTNVTINWNTWVPNNSLETTELDLYYIENNNNCYNHSHVYNLVTFPGSHCYPPPPPAAPMSPNSSNRNTSSNQNLISIEENVSIDYELRVIPNPSSETIKIVGDISNFEDLKLVDMSGKQVLQTRGDIIKQNQKIDVSELKPGIYFLILSNETNTESVKVLIK